MSVTIKAIFENGNVRLLESPPTDKKVSVTVAFPDEKSMAPEILLKKNEIKFGSLAGKISVPEYFDDELDD